jgi:glycosyltransferase involved in cell wall biosynthesis
MNLIVLIPAYYAERTLPELIRRVRLALPDAGILVVDDGSPDATAHVAEESGAIVLRHTANKGKGAALQTGFDYIRLQTSVDFVLTMDADLQHLPEDIPNFTAVQKEQHADLIVGWRQRRGTRMPLHRRMSNAITSALVGMRTGIRIKDSQCGFRLIRKKVLEEVFTVAPGYEAETEFLIKAAKRSFRFAWAPVHTVYGEEKSYMTHWKTTAKFLRVLFKEYL